MEGVVASISDDREQKRAMRGHLRRKYPFMFSILSFIAALRRENNGRVVVEIVDA